MIIVKAFQLPKTTTNPIVHKKKVLEEGTKLLKQFDIQRGENKKIFNIKIIQWKASDTYQTLSAERGYRCHYAT